MTLRVAASCITHPFGRDTFVRAAALPVAGRPLFVPAVIEATIHGVADLYVGTIEGRRRAFFAHPCLQNWDSEASLLLQFRAHTNPQTIQDFVPRGVSLFTFVG